MGIFKTKITHIVIIFVAACVGFISMSIANAAPADGSKSASCETLNIVADGNAGCDDGAAEKRVSGVIRNIVQIISIAAGIIAVIMLIVAGLKYITSNGDANAIGSAKRTIIYAIVGLVIAASAQIIVQLVLNRSASSVSPGVNQQAIDEARGELDSAREVLGEKEAALEKADPDEKTDAKREYDVALEKFELVSNQLDDASVGSGPKSAPTATKAVCYNVPITHGSKVEGRMYHKLDGQTYAFENSPEGIAYAAKHGYDSIDLDVHVSKDGIPVATHWGRPMANDGFYDPEGRLGKDTQVSDMTYAQLHRLKNKDGQSRIYSLKEMTRHLYRYKISLSLEVKAPRTLPKYYKSIASQLNGYRIKAIVKADANQASMRDALSDARKVGFWTRGTEGSQGWKKPSCG